MLFTFISIVHANENHSQYQDLQFSFDLKNGAYCQLGRKIQDLKIVLFPNQDLQNRPNLKVNSDWVGDVNRRRSPCVVFDFEYDNTKGQEVTCLWNKNGVYRYFDITFRGSEPIQLPVSPDTFDGKIFMVFGETNVNYKHEYLTCLVPSKPLDAPLSWMLESLLRIKIFDP